MPKAKHSAQFAPLPAAELLVRAGPCTHEHWSPPRMPVDVLHRVDCAEVDCEDFCDRCAWLRDA